MHMHSTKNHSCSSYFSLITREETKTDAARLEVIARKLCCHETFKGNHDDLQWLHALCGFFTFFWKNMYDQLLGHELASALWSNKQARIGVRQGGGWTLNILSPERPQCDSCRELLLPSSFTLRHHWFTWQVLPLTLPSFLAFSLVMYAPKPLFQVLHLFKSSR